MKINQKTLIISLFFLSIATLTFAKPLKQEFYEIKIYSILNKAQEDRMDTYLKDAYIPAMHRIGIKTIGVFKPRSTTDSFGKLIYVLTPLKSQSQILDIANKLEKDHTYQSAGADYINAAFDNKTFERFETIILKAFPDAPKLILPSLNGPTKDRIYELRSYEGPTEKYYKSKVKMFNAGGEVALFKRLNFNAVFYGEVITGSHMPNLMYLTTFENQADRDEHWKAFGSSPEWTILKAIPEYANTVSKNTQFFLFPTEYSDI